MEPNVVIATRHFALCPHEAWHVRWDPNDKLRYANICLDCGGWQLVVNRIPGDWKKPKWGDTLPGKK